MVIKRTTEKRNSIQFTERYHYGHCVCSTVYITEFSRIGCVSGDFASIPHKQPSGVTLQPEKYPKSTTFGSVRRNKDVLDKWNNNTNLSTASFTGSLSSYHDTDFMSLPPVINGGVTVGGEGICRGKGGSWGSSMDDNVSSTRTDQQQHTQQFHAFCPSPTALPGASQYTASNGTSSSHGYVLHNNTPHVLSSSTVGCGNGFMEGQPPLSRYQSTQNSSGYLDIKPGVCLESSCAAPYIQSALSAEDSSSMALVEQRLLSLLSKSPKGILGTHIPAIYREQYGEALRLHGRKLKDIFLVSNCNC
jgi:hypothetical protein